MFTGHERDEETGTDYMLARYLANTIGRFLSVDPRFGFHVSPQHWNKYSYAWNAPKGLKDPTGEYPEPDEWQADNLSLHLPPTGMPNPTTAIRTLYHAVDTVLKGSGKRLMAGAGDAAAGKIFTDIGGRNFAWDIIENSLWNMEARTPARHRTPGSYGKFVIGDSAQAMSNYPTEVWYFHADDGRRWAWYYSNGTSIGHKIRGSDPSPIPVCPQCEIEGGGGGPATAPLGFVGPISSEDRSPGVSVPQIPISGNPQSIFYMAVYVNGVRIN